MKKETEESNSEFVESEAPKQGNIKQRSNLSALLKSNKAIAVLILLLLVVIVWSMIQVRINEHRFNKEKVQLMDRYKTTIDSLEINHLTFETVVFSWSVRSEMLRYNTENLNQLLTEFVKESGADLVQVINAADNKILLSSDKKFENSMYLGALPKDITETVFENDQDVVKIFTPVMGFSSMIGILLVVRNR